ncbi:MAG: LysM peptidoglycan-binding domain-containing protein [Thermodesulfobacteriota bacterium]
MAWKEKDDMGQIRIEPDEDDPKRDLFSQAAEPEKKKPGWFKMPEEMPFGMIAVVVTALVVLFILFIPKNRNEAEIKKVAAIEQKLLQIDDRLSRIEEIKTDLSSGEAPDAGKKIDQLKGRLDKIESALSLISKQVEEKKAAVKPKAPPEIPKKETPEVVSPKSTQPIEKYHTVEPGETLFSISRKYDLKPDELLKINNLPKETTIHPGQRLLVGTQKKN